MNRLIQDLLDVTRMEAGQLAIEQSPRARRADRLRCRRRPACAGVLRVARASARRGAGPSRRLGGSRPTPPGVREPHRQRDQVHGAGRVHHGRSGTRDADVLFWVADTGAGIAVEDQPHVFDRFWQARTDEAHRRGTGAARSSRASSRPTAVASGSRARRGAGARSSSRFQQRASRDVRVRPRSHDGDAARESPAGHGRVAS